MIRGDGHSGRGCGRDGLRWSSDGMGQDGMVWKWDGTRCDAVGCDVNEVNDDVASFCPCNRDGMRACVGRSFVKPRLCARQSSPVSDERLRVKTSLKRLRWSVCVDQCEDG